MPRWPSFVTAAVAAIVAAPIGGHYLAPKDTNTPALAATSDRGSGTLVSRGIPGAPGPRAQDTKSLAQTRREGEQAALEEAREDIARLMCAYTQQAAETCSSPNDIAGAKVIIATVPDPVHSHLALRFDREMDTLEDGLQQLGWVYDRSWLPWDSTVRKAPDRWDARTFDSAEQDALEALPGILLFRHNGEPAFRANSSPLGNAMIVLLVAEKPTSGLNVVQFQNAMEFWRSPSILFGSQSPPPHAEPHALSILGPSFSGSLPSLYHLIGNAFSSENGQCAASSITVSSGSVSDGIHLRDLAALKPCGDQANVPVVASSFLPNAPDRERQLLCFISAHHPDATVAEISEKESTYGSLGSRANAPEAKPSQQNCPKPNTQTLHLPFPREVSQLRKAYDKSGVVGFSDPTGTPRTGLQLSTAEDEHEGDTIPAFAGLTGTVAMESQMASIARALAVNHAAIAVVSATDVMDEIFVARYLSQHAPNVTVIIQDADQLFLHEEANSSLGNVYVASPWPLSEENQAWTGNQDIDSNPSFPSASDQGIFLALHTLVCQNNPSAACKHDLPGFHPLFQERSGQGWTPPLWLSVVEHGHFLPVALLPSSSKDEWKLPTPSPSPSAPNGILETKTNSGSKVIATLLVVLLLWHAWACYKCRITRSFAWTYAEADQEHHRIRLLVKAALALIGSFALAFLYVVGTPVRVQNVPFWMFLALGQAVGIYASSDSIHRLLKGQGTPNPKQRTWIYAAICTVLFALTDLYLWLLVAPSSPEERMFFLYRASLPLSGASPVIPLLLMVLAFAAILHGMFARMAFYGHRIPKLPAGFDGLRCPSSKSVEDLTDLLSKWEWWPLNWKWREWALPFSILIMGLAFWIPEQHSIVSLPHGIFDWIVTLFAVLAGAFLLQNLAVASRAWRLLKHKVLIPLKQSPLRWGFTWIKGFSWQRIWTSSRNLSSNQIFGYLNRVLQTSSRSTWGGKDPQYYRPVCDLYVGAENGKPIQDFTHGMDTLHRQMQYEAEGKLRDLQMRWQKDCGPITGSAENRGMPLLHDVKDLKDGEREEVLRRIGDEEFVALLYLGYITMILIQIRQRILTAALLFVLLLLSLTSYPWMYRQSILLIMVALFLVLAGTTLHIYSEMHRDDILSRTTETEPGKLDSSFFEKVIPVLGIPLITLIASQFPEVSTFLFSWVQPGLSKF